MQFFTEAIASMSPGHCLGALEMLTVEVYTFLVGCPLYKEKMPWCPCPFKTKHTGPNYLGSTDNFSYDEFVCFVKSSPTGERGTLGVCTRSPIPINLASD